MRRLFDILIASLLLLLSLPILCVGWWGRRRSVVVHGRLGVPLRYTALRGFARHRRLRPLCYLPLLVEIIAGRLSFVGPRPVWAARPAPGYVKSAARPGLVSPYLLQQRANIAHDGRDLADLRCVRGLTVKSYFSLLLRFFVSLVIGGKPRIVRDRIELLDIAIANYTMSDAVQRIGQLAQGAHCQQVAFVNPDCLNIAHRDADYHAVLDRTPLVFADGIGIHLALKWFVGTAMQDNVNGTDMFPRLCRLAEESALPIYFIGGQPGIAEAVAANAQQRFPRLQVAGYRDGYFSADETAAVIDTINQSGARILLTAMGAPRQEKWIDQHRSQLRCGVAIGVGGLFDFYAGRIRRAPLWMREIGLEWVYRLLQEPGRMWRRYVIGNPLFLWRAWRWARATKPCTRSAAIHSVAPPTHG